MRKSFKLVAIIIILVIIGFAAGWIIKGYNSQTSSDLPIPLRLGGFKFINPLLVCDTSPDKESTTLQILRKNLENLINENMKDGAITTASIYFRDLKSNEQININGEEKFGPASLRKVPLMMTILKSAESLPDLLSRVKVMVGGEDQNTQQEIKPKDFAKIGQSYKIEDLVEKMIKYSDNNAASVLTSLVGVETLKLTFENLQVPFVVYDNSAQKTEDPEFMTTYKFSFFFRVLYNATYLNKEMSEKALQLLSDVDFKEGLVAGVPEGTIVAHKFGLTSLQDKMDNVTSRELHDCGIVYHARNPYILCVMTKSTSEIPAIEKFISSASALVYQEIDNK